jgi:hypothetical protein
MYNILFILATAAAVINAIAALIGLRRRPPGPGSPGRPWITRVILIILKGRGGPPGPTTPNRSCIVKNRAIWIPTVLAVIFAGLSIYLYFFCTPGCTDRSRYGFESEPIVWEQQMYPDSQGVTEVAQSSELVECGKHSLKLTTDLEGGHLNRSKGEAYVEIDVQNLEGKPITVWVYVPRGAVGDPQKPNGIQVFVKDKDWRSEYGTWWNITPAKVDRWCQVTLTPTRSRDSVASITPGFDPTQIRAVGVKVAIGDGSIAKYKGPIYIDAVDWPK